MSLFTSRRLHLAVEPDRVTLALMRNGRHPVVEQEWCLDVAVDGQSSAAGFKELHTILRQDPWRTQALRVTLSDRWVKYFTVNCLPGLRNLDELDQLAALRFEHLYGLSSNAWRIQADWGYGAAAALACAAPKPLLEALGGLGRLAHVQPFFIAEFNRHRRQLGKDAAWFAVVERHSLTLGFIAAGQWRGVRAHPIPSSPLETLAQAIQRDRPLFGEDEGNAPIFLAGMSFPMEGQESGIHILPASLWPGKAAAWSQEYRLALTEYWP